MSTPEISGTSTIKSKYSPFCSGGISKSLLTPCRQIGLSRKRKTSFNKSVKNSENLNTTNDRSINDYCVNETTPVTRKNISSGRRKNNLLINLQATPLPDQELSLDSGLKNVVEGNEGLQETYDIPCKKELLQSFTSKELFDINADQLYSVEDAITENIKKLPEMIDNTQQLNVEFIEKGKNNIGQNTSDHKNYSKLKKRRLSSNFPNFENICIKNEKSSSQTAISDSSDDDFVVSKNSKTKQKNIELKTKYGKKTLSSHCVDNSSFESDYLKDNNSMKNIKVQLQKLSEDDIKSNNFIDSNIKTFNKKCNSDSIEDTDFFTSTPEEEMTKRKNLEKKMTVLENQIKQKRSIVENLQRASIYKSKHNILELKQLTSLWLDGCVQALRHLLTLLQAHGPIDLTTLLNNMQIPQEIVAKLPL